MKVSIIGTVGVPACYGGFESLVENLLPSEKFQLVYCSAKAYDKQVESYQGATLKYWNIGANGISSIPYDILSIFHTVFKTKNDLLILGVSGALALPFVRLFTKRKVITNIDGLEWKRDKWNWAAKAFLKLSERLAVRFSDTVVADNAGIAEYVEAEYGVKSTVIAYGGDHALGCSKEELKEENNNSYALALCRIEPENNCHVILDAFSKMPNKKIKFIGNWDNSEYGLNLKREYSNFNNIELIDPIYNIEELYKYRSSASVYIHGHSAGGTNPSLVEMMFFNLPIVCFDCVYNRATTEEQADFFSSSKQLVELFEKKEIRECGEALMEIAHRRYTWKVVKNQYEVLFDD
ncbi:DUF1972 domain-containing protein [Pseudoalteromonas piscicida]|uniref:Glycosyl transferase n=1 Tax=Pseudoalteromonas piscicida TaxID=43662 RepID=A0A2A5JWA3_PSEO7|nr:DUF1972 domain-containing protein [Pseudoalteromonas piscicida]PCK33627.1 glycosyl transferase [Pseudoalteromonas piscicida]